MEGQSEGRVRTHSHLFLSKVVTALDQSKIAILQCTQKEVFVIQ